MPSNLDFKDLFKLFNDESVEYLVAGAHAVMVFTEPRYTKDLDVWVRATPENAARVFRALRRFGAPLHDITERDFTKTDLVYQIGVAPNRIDILMGVAGVTFEEAWDHRLQSTYDGVPIAIMGKTQLLKAKKAAGRPADLLDVTRLEAQDSDHSDR